MNCCELIIFVIIHSFLITRKEYHREIQYSKFLEPNIVPIPKSKLIKPQQCITTMNNNNSKDLYSTKATDFDFASADKDSEGVLYSTDGKRLLGIERDDFDAYEYVIKEGTEVICDNAFENSSIRNIILPNSVIVIGRRAFDTCRKLHNITIGNGVKKIKEAAFRCCSELEELLLPDSIETIENIAFFHTGLKELIIPQLCSKITGNPIMFNNVRIKSKSPYFIVDDNILYTSNKHELISFQAPVSSYTIPNSVTRISNYAFVCSTNLEKIVISPSVQEIGYNPFAFCNIIITNKSKNFSFKRGLLTDLRRNAIIGYYSNEKTVHIPNGIKIIECSAFCQSKITEVKIPYSIKSIRNYAFQYSSIEKIKLPNSIKYLGNFVFANCSSLIKVNLPKYLDCYGEGLFSGCKYLKSIDLPDCITHLKRGTFYRCDALENVIISNSMQRICKFAFYGCMNIKEIILPNNIEYIGKSAFQFCRRLKAVYIPNSVKFIGFKAFNDCQWISIHRIGRRSWREYDSMNLIATTPGNKDRLVKMLPKFLHEIIREMTYKEFINRQRTVYRNVTTDEEYNFSSLKRVKCQRCGNWYFEEDGGCDVCGYPWNE